MIQKTGLHNCYLVIDFVLYIYKSYYIKVHNLKVLDFPQNVLSHPIAIRNADNNHSSWLFEANMYINFVPGNCSTAIFYHQVLYILFTVNTW